MGNATELGALVQRRDGFENLMWRGWGSITDLGGCHNYDPFLGTLNIRGRIIIGTLKGTIILTTTHLGLYGLRLGVWDVRLRIQVWGLGLGLLDLDIS